MDPALRELIEGSGEEEVEAILHLAPDAEVPQHVRVVARFGEVLTVRLPRRRIAETWADESVVSLKAARPFGLDPDPLPSEGGPEELGEGFGDVRRPEGLDVTGRDVIVAVVDWGFDFAHPNFRRRDGSTRILALWDQSAPGPGPEPYGYGRIHTREEIDRALRTDEPYRALGYHPASGDPSGRGAHGTHVLDIAAGNGRAEGAPVGVASEADVVCVQVATRGTGGQANLGDSVTLLEGLDWIARQSGVRPWVANLSVGRHGGPHTGLTLVERGIDALVSAAPGRAVVQSTGNYYAAGAHASGTLRPAQRRSLRWSIDPADVTPNELEIWYPGTDAFEVEVRSPDGENRARALLGGQHSIHVGDREVGRLYHRAQDPANGDNHIDLFLDPGAPPGRWQVTLIGDDVVDGRWHAWVERDAGCPGCQSRLDPEDADPETTTGTIANGFRSLVVGAYDAHSPDRPVAPFSSCGPTRDGRLKPDLLAPGVRVLAARSASRELGSDTPLLTRNSGTSMAAPHVTGAVALMFEAAPRPLAIQETRKLLLASAREPESGDQPPARLGSGFLDIEAAVEAARNVAAAEPRQDERIEPAPLGTELETSDPEDSMDYPTLSLGCRCAARENASDGAETDETHSCSCRGSHSWKEPEWDGALEAQPDEEPEEDEWESEDEEDESEDSGESAWEREVTAPFGQSWQPAAELLELAEGAAAEPGASLLDRVLARAGAADGTERFEVAGPPAVEWWGRSLSPATLFDSILAGGAPRDRFEATFEVLALPGELPEEAPREGDLLVRRALGEGGLGHVAMVAGTAAELSAGEAARAGTFVPVVEAGALPHGRAEGFARLALDPAGRLPLDQLLLRPRIARPDFGGEIRPVRGFEAIAEAHTCRAGEGPPAALPDPDGKGLHPLVYRGSTKLRSRNGTVGDAQELLNRFLDLTRGGFSGCANDSKKALDFMEKQRKLLQKKGQDPLDVDCRFGPNTEIATKIFQTCMGIDPDGKIGPITWRHLEGFRPVASTLRPRPCCIMASTIPIASSNIADPASLGDHGTGTEANGLIYSGKAGFLDLGHIREICDITQSVFEQILAQGSSVAVVHAAHGFASFKKPPANRAEAIRIARAIGVDDGLGHEITSYDVALPGGHNSAFSPEDLCSNFLGSVLAERALAAGGVFNDAVTKELDKLVKSLDGQTPAESRKAFNRIKSRWVDFTGPSSVLATDYLKRRNFDQTPFKTGHSSDAPTPSFVTTPLGSFSAFYDYFHLEGGKLLAGAAFAKRIATIKTDARSRYGPDFDKP